MLYQSKWTGQTKRVYCLIWASQKDACFILYGWARQMQHTTSNGPARQNIVSAHMIQPDMIEHNPIWTGQLEWCTSWNGLAGWRPCTIPNGLAKHNIILSHTSWWYAATCSMHIFGSFQLAASPWHTSGHNSMIFPRLLRHLVALFSFIYPAAFQYSDIFIFLLLFQYSHWSAYVIINRTVSQTH